MTTASSYLEAVSKRPCQVEQLKRLLHILSMSHVALDLTPMGHGKSFVSIAIAEAWAYQNIVVICPSKIAYIWDDLLKKKTTAPNGLPTPTNITSRIITFETLREPNRCDLLDATIVETGKSKQLTKRKIDFFPTPKLKELVKGRTLFIFDEIHAAKNITTSTHAACSTVIRAVGAVGSVSENMGRCVLLTGTLFDTPDLAVNLMVMTGILKSPSLISYNRSLKTTIHTGLSDLSVYIHVVLRKKSLDTEVVGNFGQRGVLTKKTAADAAFNMILQYIIPSISSSTKVASEIAEKSLPPKTPLVITKTGTDKFIPSVVKMAISDTTTGGGPSETNKIFLNVRNLFIPISEKSKETYSEALNQVIQKIEDAEAEAEKKKAAAVEKNRIKEEEKMNLDNLVNIKQRKPVFKIKKPETLQVKIRGTNLANVNKKLAQVESAKCEIFTRKAIQALTQHPNKKVVIALNYLDNIETVYQNLNKAALAGEFTFTPGKESPVSVLTGQVLNEERSQMVKAFQAPNTQTRVLVASLRVISLGISLDDQHGSFPRFILVSPSYYAIDQHQFIRRFYRANTQSEPVVRTVFGEKTGKLREDQVLMSLATKAAILRATAPIGASDKILYSDEILSEHEDN